MAPSSSKMRIMKTPQQIQLLEEQYQKGMISTKQKAMVVEASIKTGLPVSSVNDWLNNKRNPNRGSNKKRGTKLNVYTAFMANSNTDFNPKSQSLGDLTKARALEYRKLKKTQKGKKQLKENLEKMNDLQSTDLSELQKTGRAKGMFEKVKEQSNDLLSMGYKATTLVAYPNGDHSILGNPEGVYFFHNHQKVAHDYVQYVSQSTAPFVTDSKEVNSNRVLNLFNKLYGEAIGQTNAHMPYKAIKEGRNIILSGLPNGIVFKKPQSYGKKELIAILQAQSSLKVIIG